MGCHAFSRCCRPILSALPHQHLTLSFRALLMDGPTCGPSALRLLVLLFTFSSTAHIRLLHGLRHDSCRPKQTPTMFLGVSPAHAQPSGRMCSQVSSAGSTISVSHNHVQSRFLAQQGQAHRLAKDAGGRAVKCCAHAKHEDRCIVKTKRTQDAEQSRRRTRTEHCICRSYIIIIHSQSWVSLCKASAIPLLPPAAASILPN